MSKNGQAITRITKEAREMQTDPPPGIRAAPVGDDLFHWVARIDGAEETPYEGGKFYLDVHLHKSYPFKAPKVNFITKVYHPNINGNGGICLDILKKQWVPAYTIDKLLLSISALMCEPNPDDPLVPNIAKEYRTKRNRYNRTAATWTENYASTTEEPYGVDLEYPVSGGSGKKKAKKGKGKKAKGKKAKAKAKKGKQGKKAKGKKGKKGKKRKSSSSSASSSTVSSFSSVSFSSTASTQSSAPSSYGSSCSSS